ncbi:hypothetical protein LK540_03780 [Massilia sp. IC2-278]|uniref:hypothetical protein n=1 Tax=Massilia sp. IC2-278 TaxID=2887200 RepID=UPI001E535FDD|nr:hypothetical protein [Massilia sp. IC2-278]MCC2959546.1 hypothetical protein [Massilia sp. IC2-278]
MLFLCAALFGVRFRPIEPAQLGGLLFITTIFFIIPAGHYACFLCRRLVRNVDGMRGNERGRLVFVPRPATRGEHAFPLACVAVFEGIAVLWDMLG